ncbi:MAG: heme-binding protein [Pseudomonadota bacterium]
MNISLETALEVIAAAKKKARDISVPMVIAVVDAGANLVALQRMDDALLASVEIAADKAYTAVALKMPTAQLAQPSQPGQPLFGLNAVSGGRIIIFGGGIPLKKDGRIIGGVGVSGGSVEDDQACAQAGVDRLAEP